MLGIGSEVSTTISNVFESGQYALTSLFKGDVGPCNQRLKNLVNRVNAMRYLGFFIRSHTSMIEKPFARFAKLPPGGLTDFMWSSAMDGAESMFSTEESRSYLVATRPDTSDSGTQTGGYHGNRCSSVSLDRFKPRVKMTRKLSTRRWFQKVYIVRWYVIRHVEFAMLEGMSECRKVCSCVRLSTSLWACQMSETL